MSQTCPNCGTLNLDSYRFCSNCGTPLGPGGQATQPITPPVPPVSAPDTGTSGSMEQPAPAAPISTSSVSFEPPQAAQPAGQEEEKSQQFSYESATPFSYEPPPSTPPEDDKLVFTPFESSPAAPASSENVTTASYTPPPSAQGGSAQESVSSPTTPEQPWSEPAYVVKTSPESISFGSTPPTTPEGGSQPTVPMPVPPPPQYPSMSMPDQQGPAVPPPMMQYPGYQGYNPGASATPNANANPNNSMNKDGGVYAPYTAGSTAALEKPNEPRSWLMPVIVVAALLLVGLAAIGFFASQQKGSGTASNAPLPGVGSQVSPAPTSKSGTSNKPVPTSTSLPANASEEDRIRAVILNSNDQQIKAWKELETNYLLDNYTGPALEENKQQVQQLKQLNLRAEPAYSRLDVLSVDVQDENTATAKTSETWTVTYFDAATGKESKTEGPTTYNETYHLVKQNGKWLINQLDIQPGAPPSPTRSGT